MTHVEYEICDNQGRLYEYMAHAGYDIQIFSDLYLGSDFCRRAFDTTYSRFQYADEPECLDFLMPEIGERCTRTISGTMFSPDVAKWIGFAYRHLYIATGIPSTELKELVPFSSMCRYYPGLHTVDEEMAIDIICKDHGLKRRIS